MYYIYYSRWTALLFIYNYNLYDCRWNWSAAMDQITRKKYSWSKSAGARPVADTGNWKIHRRTLWTRKLPCRHRGELVGRWPSIIIIYRLTQWSVIEWFRYMQLMKLEQNENAEDEQNSTDAVPSAEDDVSIFF